MNLLIHHRFLALLVLHFSCALGARVSVIRKLSNDANDKKPETNLCCCKEGECKDRGETAPTADVKRQIHLEDLDPTSHTQPENIHCCKVRKKTKRCDKGGGYWYKAKNKNLGIDVSASYFDFLAKTESSKNKGTLEIMSLIDPGTCERVVATCPPCLNGEAGIMEIADVEGRKNIVRSKCTCFCNEGYNKVAEDGQCIECEDNYIKQGAKCVEKRALLLEEEAREIQVWHPVHKMPYAWGSCCCVEGPCQNREGEPLRPDHRQILWLEQSYCCVFRGADADKFHADWGSCDPPNGRRVYSQPAADLFPSGYLLPSCKRSRIWCHQCKDALPVLLERQRVDICGCPGHDVLDDVVVDLKQSDVLEQEPSSPKLTKQEIAQQQEEQAAMIVECFIVALRENPPDHNSAAKMLDGKRFSYKATKEAHNYQVTSAVIQGEKPALSHYERDDGDNLERKLDSIFKKMERAPATLPSPNAAFEPGTGMTSVTYTFKVLFKKIALSVSVDMAGNIVRAEVKL